MNNIKCFFFITILFATINPLFATPKGKQPKLELTCDFKKLRGNEYELLFKVNLEKGMYVKANNDFDSVQKLKIPYFIFDGNDLYHTIGDISSKGLIETKKLKRIGIVNVYSYTVLYNQKVTAMPGTTINGIYNYQMCNDKTAKRVKSLKFSIIVK